ncbi:hypothetical protein BTUL_0104g00280 [Botrytis tulipae]|uniref:Uncharacterized protein n=1 Tax=Botrytis tulipae TaxID=87230 RepID=A0A4Z1EMX1_9HELO|nr:hypothetical protein BTUL_0104g00280 [Botrytis tulipae]
MLTISWYNVEAGYHNFPYPLKLYKSQNPSDRIQYSTSDHPRRKQHHPTNLLQLPLLDKMGAATITVINNSTADVSVSVTYDGNDFQKGGSEAWTALKANGGTDTWNYRADNQIVRVARSQNAGTGIESYLAVPGKTIYII